jgi:hypothetical protein
MVCVETHHNTRGQRGSMGFAALYPSYVKPILLHYFTPNCHSMNA